MIRFLAGPPGTLLSAVAAGLATRRAQEGARVLCVALGSEEPDGIPLGDLVIAAGGAPFEPGGKTSPRRASRGELVHLTLDPKGLGEALVRECAGSLDEIVQRCIAGALAPLGRGDDVTALALDGARGAGLALALVELRRIAEGPDFDELVVALGNAEPPSALHRAPEALRRWIDALDALQAVRRHALRASGARRGDQADALLTRLASQLEEIWGLLRRPDCSELRLASLADPAAIAASLASIEELATQGVPVQALLVEPPAPARCEECSADDEAAGEALAGARRRSPVPVIALSRSLLLPLVASTTGPPRTAPSRTLATALRKLGSAVLGEGAVGETVTRAAVPLASRPRAEAVAGRGRSLLGLDEIPLLLLAGSGLALRSRLAAALTRHAGTAGVSSLIDASGELGGAFGALPEGDRPVVRRLDGEIALGVARERLARALRRALGGDVDSATIARLLDLAPRRIADALALAAAIETATGRIVIHLGSSTRALSLLEAFAAARAFLERLGLCLAAARQAVGDSAPRWPDAIPGGALVAAKRPLGRLFLLADSAGGTFAPSADRLLRSHEAFAAAGMAPNFLFLPPLAKPGACTGCLAAGQRPERALLLLARGRPAPRFIELSPAFACTIGDPLAELRSLATPAPPKRAAGRV